MKKTIPLLLALLAFLPSAQSAVVFTPEQPSVLIDFENLELNSTLNNAGWTNTTGASNMTVVTPRVGSGGGAGSRAVQASDAASASDWLAFSPSQTVSPIFDLGEKIYFSAYLSIGSSASSGARVGLRDASGNFLGGFGIVNSGSNAFAYSPSATASAGAWVSTGTNAIDNHWYEVALVISLNATDVTQSLGWLFIKDLTAGDAEFTLISSEDGFNMAYSAGINATGFSSFRLASFRNGAQVDNLAAGIAVIPEPTIGGLLGAGALTLSLLCYGRKK